MGKTIAKSILLGCYFAASTLFFFCYAYNQHADKTDDEISRAIDRSIIKLYKIAGKRTIQRDFEDAKKTLSVIDEMKNRRDKNGK